MGSVAGRGISRNRTCTHLNNKHSDTRLLRWRWLTFESHTHQLRNRTTTDALWWVVRLRSGDKSARRSIPENYCFAVNDHVDSFNFIRVPEFVVTLLVAFATTLALFILRQTPALQPHRTPPRFPYSTPEKNTSRRNTPAAQEAHHGGQSRLFPERNQKLILHVRPDRQLM